MSAPFIPPPRSARPALWAAGLVPDPEAERHARGWFLKLLAGEPPVQPGRHFTQRLWGSDGSPVDFLQLQLERLRRMRGEVRPCLLIAPYADRMRRTWTCQHYYWVPEGRDPYDAFMDQLERVNLLPNRPAHVKIGGRPLRFDTGVDTNAA